MEIIIDNLYYKYKNNKDNSLNNINLRINSKTITGIIGNIGSGKTTLLEILDLLILPTIGKITINDKKINSKTKKKELNNIRKNIGYVFQDTSNNLFELNVKKELEGKLDKEEILKLLGLDNSYLNKEINNLSNSEKKKIALASVIIKNPKILLLDNPELGLDSKGKKGLIKLLRNLKVKYEKTIVIVSEDVNFIHAVCDDVVILNNGEIKLSGNKYKVFTNEKVLLDNNIKKPNMIEISDEIYKKKNIKIGYRDDINDLIKDIYRYVK